MKNYLFAVYLLLGLTALPAFSGESKPRVRLAIIGLVHTHVRGFLPQALTNKDVGKYAAEQGSRRTRGLV